MKAGGLQESLRRLPAVEKILASSVCREALKRHSRRLVVEAVRRLVEERREKILRGKKGEPVPVAPITEAEVLQALTEQLRPPLRRVLNATGVVVHTNLGRAPLSRAAIEDMANIAGGYSNLEFDLRSGRRGKRISLIRDILVQLTGAEEALVVNNNAAAVFLALRVLSGGREAIISRGELVEIGGSFRMPEIMAAAGVNLVEVGTTNRTRADDYRRAIGPQTALLLKVHRSNFDLIGFSQEVDVPELAALAHQHGLPLMVDMGWATLLEKWPARLGMPYHPRHLLGHGADLVCFSGDKLLGGPQAGILLGRSAIIKALAQDPLARVLRVGKLTLAALWQTLRAYKEGEGHTGEIPVVNMLVAEADELQPRARRLKNRLRQLVPILKLELERSRGRAGGGALPQRDLPGWAVVLTHPRLEVDRLAAALRGGEPPLLCRIRRGRIWLDVRTLADEDITAAAQAVADAVKNASRH